MASKKKTASKFSQTAITKYLEELGQEVYDWHEDKGQITRDEALARKIWDKALGYEERIETDEGIKIKHHKPESWAIQLIYERREGRSPQAVQEQKTGPSAAEKVRDLSKKRINNLTAKVAGKSAPPTFEPEDSSGE